MSKESKRRDYRLYFKDELRYPQIQQPGPLALLAEAEGAELNANLEAARKMRDQFFPALAENEALAFHGQARGVPRHLKESDAQHRMRVENAFGWQRLAGRHWGLHQIFSDYGFPIIKLTQLTGERWAQFDLRVEALPGVPLTQEVWDLVYWLVFEYKRASAMPRYFLISKQTRGHIKIKVGLAIGERIIVYPPTPEIPRLDCEVKTKLAPLTHERWTVYPNTFFRRFKAPALARLKFPLSPIKRFSATGGVKLKFPLE